MRWREYIGLICTKWIAVPLLSCALMTFHTVGPTGAASIPIVALGASNAQGYGVGSEQAWPAQLARMLSAKGFEVSVSVSAVFGDTSSGILSRIDSAVPRGTRVVVFDGGRFNDRRQGIPASVTQANIEQIKSRIRSLGAVPIETPYYRLRGQYLQEDGVHLTVQGHSLIASYLVPSVIAALGARR